MGYANVDAGMPLPIFLLPLSPKDHCKMKREPPILHFREPFNESLLRAPKCRRERNVTHTVHVHNPDDKPPKRRRDYIRRRKSAEKRGESTVSHGDSIAAISAIFSSR